jgi:DNA-binding MarR family transcriptional regulator
VDLVGVDEVVRLRRALTGITRRFNAAATEEGLSPGEASALGLIARFGPLTADRLLELEQVDKGTLSRLVADLSAHGLVSRQRQPDGPGYDLAVTARGRTVHERIKTRRAALVSDRIVNLAPHQRSALLQALPTLESLAERG